MPDGGVSTVGQRRPCDREARRLDDFARHDAPFDQTFVRLAVRGRGPR